MSSIHGWYDFQWSGGSFLICFRPGGTFFAPKFQAQARWEMKDNVVQIDWVKFGKYEMTFDPETRSMTGNGIPKTDAETNWRKAKFLNELSPTESLLLGDGAGTKWDFAWKGGTFEIQFKGDGFNHFKCEDFPAHAHWSLEGNELKIFWAEFGNYKMDIDLENKTMSGGEIGGDETKDTWWRKASNPTKLMDQKTLEHCEHHH